MSIKIIHLGNFNLEELKNQFKQRLNSIVNDRYSKNAQKLADICELPRTKIQNYLNGRSLPLPDALIKLSLGTGKSIEWLITGKDFLSEEERVLIQRFREADNRHQELALITLMDGHVEIKKKKVLSHKPQ